MNGTIWPLKTLVFSGIYQISMSKNTTISKQLNSMVMTAQINFRLGLVLLLLVKINLSMIIMDGDGMRIVMDL